MICGWMLRGPAVFHLAQWTSHPLALFIFHFLCSTSGQFKVLMATPWSWTTKSPPQETGMLTWSFGRVSSKMESTIPSPCTSLTFKRKSQGSPASFWAPTILLLEEYAPSNPTKRSTCWRPHLALIARVTVELFSDLTTILHPLFHFQTGLGQLCSRVCLWKLILLSWYFQGWWDEDGSVDQLVYTLVAVTCSRDSVCQRFQLYWGIKPSFSALLPVSSLDRATAVSVIIEVEDVLGARTTAVNR